MTGERPTPDISYSQEVVPAESIARRYVRAGSRVLAGTFDIGFLVLGTSLLGLSAAVLADGISLVELGLTSSVGEMLATVLVVAVLGAFGLGVAVEGPLRRGTKGLSLTHFELAVFRATSLLLMGAGMVVLGRFLDRFVPDLPGPFSVVTEFIAVVGFAGLTATAIFGVAGVWAAQRLTSERVAVEAEMPILFIVWAVGAAMIFTL